MDITLISTRKYKYTSNMFSSSISGNEDVGVGPNSNTGNAPGNSTMDTSEKTADLINSPEVQAMKEGEGKDFIDIDFEHLDEGKYYRVEYQGDVYGVEKLANGKIAFYEVVN